MSKYFISINPFAEFSASTKAAKKRIIKQQLSPNKLLIPWYQLAKAALKRYFANIKETRPIHEAIEILSKKVPDSKRQLIDKNVSIEALKKSLSIQQPEMLSKINYSLVTSDLKDITLNNVIIRVAPDVIIKGNYQGKTVYGAVKFHVCKSKPFDSNQASLVSTLLFQFLNKRVAKPGDLVLPELCLCFDVFAERLVQAPSDSGKHLAVIKSICEEIKQEWPMSA